MVHWKDESTVDYCSGCWVQSAASNQNFMTNRGGSRSLKSLVLLLNFNLGLDLTYETFNLNKCTIFYSHIPKMAPF